MPNEIVFFNASNRALWINRTLQSVELQIQDGPWISQRFTSPLLTLEQVATSLTQTLELKAENPAASLKLLWRRSTFYCEYVDDTRHILEEFGAYRLLLALRDEVSPTERA